MAKHRHAEMIKAKADNMDLVKFIKVNGKWIVDNLGSCHFDDMCEYFPCLPQHKDACLHWLSGGDVEYQDFPTSEWLVIHNRGVCSWGLDVVFMQEEFNIRIKPRKEKRWIVAKPSALVSMMYFEKKQDAYDAVKFSTGEFKGGQVIEIEVEL